MSTGRSPYRSRSSNRRRSSLEAAPDHHTLDPHRRTPPFSPATATTASANHNHYPLAHNATRSSSSRRFFPDSRAVTALSSSRDGGILGAVTAGPRTPALTSSSLRTATTNTTPAGAESTMPLSSSSLSPSSPATHVHINNNINNMNPKDSLVLDDIPISTCRRLAQNCLLDSPPMAVFYASIAFHKTLHHGNDDDDEEERRRRMDEDASSLRLLYARALHQNGEHRRCVHLLLWQSLVLVSEDGRPTTPSTSTSNTDTSNNNIKLQAILLATQALAALQEWSELLELLEQTLAYDDDDEDAWNALVQQQQQQGGSIHPVALLCWWRGRAYEELSHPQRAVTYFVRALQTDPLCVPALESLFGWNNGQHNNTHEVMHMVLNLELDESMEWLRRLYLARVDLPVVATSGGDMGGVGGGGGNHSGGEPSQPFRVDASAIHPPSMMTTPNILMDDDNDDNNKPDENNQKLPSSTATTTALSLQKTVDDAFDKLWSVHKLQESPEALAVAATRSYRRHDLQQALHYCQQLFAQDPLSPQASLVHVATLLALNQKRILFGLAHSWVEASPKLARSWFAVGAYYYACGRYHAAQRHFCRATRLDPQCVEAWIAFGCAFAACDESDQALATFRAAQRLAPAQHVPLLYMGMEYLRTNHMVLAQHFLSSAYKASGGGDPLCLHELGVAAYQKCDYDAAIVWLTRALQAVVVKKRAVAATGADRGMFGVREAIDACQDDFWEPTLFNLGHCYRRTRQFEEAAYCFGKCLALRPGNSTTFTALGFTKHLQGDTDRAIELYHQALSRKPDDPFSSEMLNRALQEALTAKLTMDDVGDVATITTPTKSFRSPDTAGRTMTFRSDKKRRSVGGNMSMASDGSPGLSMMDDSDDVDMSLS